MRWASMTIRLRALGIGLAAILAGTMSVPSAELKDPLSPLTSAKGSILCFRRDYSPMHLAQHPKQMIKSVLLAFQQGFVTSSLTPRRGARSRLEPAAAGRRERGSIPPATR